MILKFIIFSIKYIKNNQIIKLQEEINSITKIRRDFEFKFLRRPPNRNDYIKAIEYEKKLEKLRSIRKVKAGIEQPLKSDESIINRIIFIYDRGTMHMPADIELWEEYIEYCQSLHKEKKVDTIFQSYLIFILDFYHYILIMKDFVLKHVNGRLIMVMFQLQEVFIILFRCNAKLYQT